MHTTMPLYQALSHIDETTTHTPNDLFVTLPHTAQLMSTMPGVKFYQRHGYEILREEKHKFVGVDVELCPMQKHVEKVTDRGADATS